MTEAQRSDAISLILSETPNIMSDMSVVETVLRLKLSHYEIGPGLWAAIDEARAQRKQTEAA